jgi:hypothetical protein
MQFEELMRFPVSNLRGKSTWVPFTLNISCARQREPAARACESHIPYDDDGGKYDVGLIEQILQTASKLPCTIRVLSSESVS